MNGAVDEHARSLLLETVVIHEQQEDELADATPVCLMVLFFGPTKLIPIAFALATIYIALSRPALFATG